MAISEARRVERCALVEHIRTKGQVWTPGWVADAMVRYVAGSGARLIFDPAVGTGAFFRAARRLGAATGREFQLSGMEIDKATIVRAEEEGLAQADVANVVVGDFLSSPMISRCDAIVANPPYIRHHRISAEQKARLRSYSLGLVGAPIDGRAGAHVFFLIRALDMLTPGGRLAFILPADTFEGVFAPTLWRWITRDFNLECVVAFAPEATPFPGVDTNAVIVFISRTPPSESVWWVRCSDPESPALNEYVGAGFGSAARRGLDVSYRSLAEALQTGLSRPPSLPGSGRFKLGSFARVMRGIATGANDYFFLTAEKVRELGLATEFLVPAIGRTRDVTDDTVNAETLARLVEAGRPTLLFAPDGREAAHFPEPVRHYILRGELMGLPMRALIATRRPWYRMERRAAPPILFAYLGRRNARFIRNEGGVVPLTGFLCVYPLSDDAAFMDGLWRVLRHPDTVANLRLVGKSYGGGAIKVEPRALERLPLPDEVVRAAGLTQHAKPKQVALNLGWSATTELPW